MAELKYIQCGDYLIPEMGLSEDDTTPLGKYGRMRYRYLEQERQGLFTELLLSGDLMRQLHEVDQEAQQMLETLLPKMAREAGLSEEMKNTDPMRWVGTMNTLKAQVEEIIFAEVVYC